MRVRPFFPLLLVSLLVAGLGCSRNPDSQKESPRAAARPAERPAVPINVAEVQTRRVERLLEMVGSLMPNDEVTVSSVIPGRVEAIHADLGDRVTKGQALVRLDQREYLLNIEQLAAALQLTQQNLARSQAVLSASKAAQETVQADLRSAQAQVEKAEVFVNDARINLGRMKRLYSEGIVAASQQDTAQAQYDSAVAQLSATKADYQAREARIKSAEAQVKQDEAAIRVAQASVEAAQAALSLARKRLSDTIIYAPMTGAVQKRMVSSGESIKEMQPLFSLVSADPIKLEGEVPERYTQEVALGKAVKVQVEAFPGETFMGRIARISPAVKADSRSLTIQALLENQKERLRPGFFAKAFIVTKMEDTLFVPEKALVTLVGVTKLFVLDKEKKTVAAQTVTTGIRQDGMIEIAQGVKPAELVAVSSLSRLNDGSRVTISSSQGKE